jgi:S-formylglutathione hydrolase FrmB
MPERLRRLRVASRALGCARTVLVHLPEAYERADQQFPAVYLLRGHHREWANPREDSHRAARSAPWVADALVRQGRMGPVVLVMPPLTSADGRVHSLGVNLRAPRLARGAAGVGRGCFEDFLVHDVIPAVERHFRVLPGGRHRAVDGFSVGGFAALSLALRHAGLFASVGAFDGTFLYADGVTPDGIPDHLLSDPSLAAALGQPVDLDHLRRYNPANLVQTVPDALLRQLRVHLQCAPRESEPSDSNFFRTEHLLRLLEARGQRNALGQPVLPGSRHNWYWADEHLLRSLPWHESIIRAGAGAG